MIETYEIGEVARHTGLSHRALRFYEARGLVRPLRLAGGRRVYGAGELARLHAVVALKRAGFSLAEIARTLAGRDADLARLIAAQIDDLDRQAREIAAARRLLSRVRSRIDRGEPIDVATLCSLIRAGDTTMTDDMNHVIDRYITPAERAEWERQAQQLPADFDQDTYALQWQTLGARIDAALGRPGGVAPDEAEGFVRDWFALLAPFSRVATPAMWEGAARVHAHSAEWQDVAAPPFSPAAWALIRDTATRMRAAGEEVGPLPAFVRPDADGAPA